MQVNGICLVSFARLVLCNVALFHTLLSPTNAGIDFNYGSVSNTYHCKINICVKDRFLFVYFPRLHLVIIFVFAILALALLWSQGERVHFWAHCQQKSWPTIFLIMNRLTRKYISRRQRRYFDESSLYCRIIQFRPRIMVSTIKGSN